MAAVIVQQPFIKTQSSAWTSGICDCCQDLNSCCYAYWCFPCFTCSTTGEFGESTCLPLLDIFGPCLLASFGIATCVPPVTLGMRVAVRYKYDIGGSLCEDIMVSCCCIWCSWCQLSREIKARKQTVTIVQTAPTMFQPIPMTTTTQVVNTQQSFEMIHTPPVAVAPEMQMAPIQTGPPTVMTNVK
ncbi:placenta-specific gene 8 protein-like [Megalobrama amblycephala]|uniref:placenta-specific gene 8 protein-like n=1 Tax=Megalobrama amblycephala TaxID=75352 RepID=UPI0020145CCE|nr:placenta-specific gene 8 protein-like [Megalobrama amblycephala]XP_048033891.1 placenta-specific gene 8 protein-like [Megalobrama amblycephala]